MHFITAVYLNEGRLKEAVALGVAFNYLKTIFPPPAPIKFNLNIPFWLCQNKMLVQNMQL